MDDVPKMKQLSDLPSNLVPDILFRLPLETLLSCRYVCKAWDGFFTNPEFVEMQLAASPIHFLERQVEKDRAIHFGRVVKADGKLQGHTIDLRLPYPTSWCVNSSNGLLCLVGCEGSVSVCNPLLGESVSIPKPVNHRGGYRSVAIGFSAKDRLYKVLVGYQLQENNYGFEIYTLGTRVWRVVDNVEGCTPWRAIGTDFNTFLHGSIHWVSVCPRTDGSRVRCLWSFNFESEKFQRLALPDESCDADYIEIQGENDEDLDVHIGIMNGYLWVCFNYNELPGEADIWIMKEYGVKESWIQILTFSSYIPKSEVLCPKGFLTYGYNGYYLRHPVLLFSFSHKDIMVTDKEDPGKSHSVHVEKVLIADDSGELICYNTKKRSERVVKFNTSSSHTYDFNYVIGYVPSFVSLQDVAKGEEVKVSRITYEAAQ